VRLQTGILLGKLLLHTARMFKVGGGTSAPGLYALKIDPNLVEKLVKQVPINIIITGTNGKTTTARLLAHFAIRFGLKVIRNSAGSNLERGIASTLISHSSLLTLNSELSKFDLGIWELDEAAFNQLAPVIKPDKIVFLNIHRDQLDRYGEINSVLDRWQSTLKKLKPKTKLIINGDDHNLSKLTEGFNGKINRFGLEEGKISGEFTDKNIKPAKLDIVAKNIQLLGLTGSKFDLFTATHPSYGGHSSQLTAHLPLPGFYHIYDFLAAFSAGLTLKIPANIMTDSLTQFIPAFGRVEKLSLKNNKEGFIFLIKNPVGATQVFQTLSSELTAQDSLLIALNDNLADGTDVSWIWDSLFEEFKIKNLKFKIIVSGTRALDLALRLKYAGFETKQIQIEPSLERALQTSQTALNGRLFILPTYTALLELQAQLTKQGIKPLHWSKLR